MRLRLPGASFGSTHTVNVPTDYNLGGIQLFTQPIVIGAGPADLGLCNALDITLGL